MAEAIKAVCGKDREEYTVACRKRAEECFDKYRFFERYVKIYEEIVKRKP